MKKHNEGFSLVETLVAITVLAIIVVPTCTSMVMSVRMNAKAKTLMQAELAVSSAVETLMAEGIVEGQTYTFPGVKVVVSSDGNLETIESHYKVNVTSQDADSVAVETYVRSAVSPTVPKTEGAG